MTVLWLAALSRLSADPNVIFDLRTKIRDQIAAVATWKPGSPILTKFSPSISGNLRVAWTGTIPFKEIPDTDVLVYFVETTIVNIARHGTSRSGWSNPSGDRRWWKAGKTHIVVVGGFH